MSSDDHLDSNRIRQMAALRRGAIRSRSYCVVAIGGCLVGAAELTFDGVRDCPAIRAFIYFLCAIALIWAAAYFFRLARRFHREAKQSAIPPPATPPDFSQLQDGSQIVRNLEEM
jgi:hypothetical protein